MALPSTICLGVVNSPKVLSPLNSSPTFFGRNSDHNNSDRLDNFTDSAPLVMGADVCVYLGRSELLVVLFDSWVFTFIFKVTFITGQDRLAGHIKSTNSGSSSLLLVLITITAFIKLMYISLT